MHVYMNRWELFEVCVVVIPTVRNALPDDIRVSPSIASFRMKLKSYLYTKEHPP